MREIAILKEDSLSGNQRNESIDVAKGLAIILMVSGHACMEGGVFVHWLHDFIYTFHMPFFMIISGYLFNGDNICQPQKYIKRKFDSLYLKFIIYNIILILLNNVLWNIGALNESYNYFMTPWQEYTVLDIIKRIIYTLFSFSNPENTGLAMWYLKDLFLTAVLFMLLLRLEYVRKHSRWLPFIFLILASLTPRYVIPYFSIMPTRVFCDLFLYSVGYQLKGHNIKIGWVVLISFFILSTISPICFTYIELQSPYGKTNIPRFLLIGVTGFLWFVAFCQWFYERGISMINKILLTINKNAIAIISLHVLSFKLLTYTWMGGVSSYNITPPTDSNFLWLLYAVTGIGFPIIIMNLYRMLQVVSINNG